MSSFWFYNSIWDYLSSLGRTFTFTAFAVMIKCMLIAFYCLILYLAVLAAKKLLRKKMGVRANYYSWYILLLSIPLSGFQWNDRFKVPIYLGYEMGSIRRVCEAVTYLWILVVFVQLISQMIISHRIKRSIAKMNPYPDQYGLKQQAADAVGLNARRIHVVISPMICSPVSYGLFRKTILLPADYEGRYEKSELYLLLLHEMFHLKNFDTVKLQLIGFLQSFLWVICLFRKPFKRDTEILCDNQVIGLAEEKRSLYGELLVKESAGKVTVKGFAFSDSYRLISRRLHALYDYRPEKRKLALFAIAILSAFLIGFCWSSLHRSDWYDYNAAYNSDFTIYVTYTNWDTDWETGEQWSIPSHVLLEEGTPFIENGVKAYDGRTVRFLSPEHFDGLYEIIDDDICVDKTALYEALAPFYSENLPMVEVTFISINYELRFYPGFEAITMASSQHTLTVDELALADETDRYFTEPLRKRGITEFLYMVAAHFA